MKQWLAKFQAALTTHPRRALFVIVLLAILVQLIYSFLFQVQPVVDARTYNNIALHLLDGSGYRAADTGALAQDSAINYVGPGYSFFLAGLYKVFGPHLAVVWVVQALLLGVSVFLAYLLARKVFPKTTQGNIGALLVGLFVGLCPDFVTVGSMLLTEALSTTLLLAWLVLLLRVLDEERGESVKTHWATVVSLAVVAFACVMVRTTFLLVLLPTFGVLVWRRFWGESVTVLGIIALLCVPWTLRNERVYHQFLPATAALGANLAIGNYAGATGEYEGFPADIVAQLATIKDPLQANAFLTHTAVQFIVHHPVQYAVLCLRRTVIVLSAVRPSAFWFHLTKQEQLVTAGLSVIHLFTIFALGLLGIVWMLKRWRILPSEERRRHAVLCIVILCLLASPIGIIAESRYRFSLYPLLALYGVYALLNWRRLNWKYVLVVDGCYVLLCLVDLSSKLSLALSRLR